MYKKKEAKNIYHMTVKYVVFMAIVTIIIFTMLSDA